MRNQDAYFLCKSKIKSSHTGLNQQKSIIVYYRRIYERECDTSVKKDVYKNNSTNIVYDSFTARL